MKRSFKLSLVFMSLTASLMAMEGDSRLKIKLGSLTPASVAGCQVSPRSDSRSATMPSPLMKENETFSPEAVAKGRPRSNSELTKAVERHQAVVSPIKDAIKTGNFEGFASLVEEQSKQGLFRNCHTPNSAERSAVLAIAQTIIAKPVSPKTDAMRALIVESVQAAVQGKSSKSRLEQLYNQQLKQSASIEELAKIKNRIKYLQQS